MKIDINKKYRTVFAKWPVTIVSTEGPYPGFPVVGYTHSPATDVPLLCHWSEVGGYPANTHLDLIEVREPREWTLVRAAIAEVMADAGPAIATGERIRVREIID